jgi:hypothetical protein
MAAMHEAFVLLAKMRRVLAFADLIGDDKAGVALRLEIPGMVEAWRRSRRIAVPADARIGHEFVDLALERKPKRRPMEHIALFEHVAAIYAHVLEFGYHCGHFVASTMCPQMRSHEALISRALCENKSACDGLNPSGQ